MPDQAEIDAATTAVFDAYRAAAEQAITAQKAVNDARRRLAEALVDETQAQLPVAPLLTADDRREIHDAALQIGLPQDPAVRWSGGDLLDLLQALPTRLARLLIDAWQADSATAQMCTWGGHLDQLDQQRHQLVAIQQAHGCWDHGPHPYEDAGRG